MAFPEDSFLPDNKCEICGAELSDEVVIQEFADGSVARLCAECAAGASLESDTDEFRFPDADDIEDELSAEGSASFDTAPSLRDSSSFDDSSSFEEADAKAVAAGQVVQGGDPDPAEKTRELLTPVVDLITLQQEMQGALQRLAASLETFATGIMTESKDKSATVESRLESLERELEQTRARLRETEALLAASGVAAAGAAQHVAGVASTEATPAPSATAPGAAAAKVSPEPAAAVAGALAAVNFFDFESTTGVTAETTGASGAGAAGPTEEASTGTLPAEPAGAAATGATAAAAAQAATSDTGPESYSAADFLAQSTAPPVPPQMTPPPVAPPAGPPTAEPHSRPEFQLAEVQLAQRYFNESPFTFRIRDVRKSLGKPRANLTKLVGSEPRAILTVAWDIIWYQYLIDLRRDIPAEARVKLHREGMDLDELTGLFKDKNSSVDDEGRLDASELEVKLLSDPSTLITQMSEEEEHALEDATEEIWDQRTAPEFKWDD